MNGVGRGNDHQYRSHFLPGAASREGLTGDSERADSPKIADARLPFPGDGSVTLSIFHRNDGQHQATAYDRNGNNIATISSEGGRLALKLSGLSQIAASEQAKTGADSATERDALNSILQIKNLADRYGSTLPDGGGGGTHGPSSRFANLDFLMMSGEPWR